MKSSIAILGAAATLAVAKPAFLNTDFDITPGEPFTLKFSGCSEGCDIILLNGDSGDLQEVQTLISDTTNDEEVITLSERFPKDVYAFRIVDSDGEQNYSEQFEFEGEDKPTSAEETSTIPETTSEAETTTEAEETTMVTVTTDTETVSTPEPSTTESETPSNTDDSDNSEETGDGDDAAPEDAATRLGASHVTLAAAVVALAGYFL